MKSEVYGDYQISWRETGQRFVALLRAGDVEKPPAVVEASVEEGMSVLKTRTYAVVDTGTVEAYRPNLSAPDHASPARAFDSFLRTKEKEIGRPLAAAIAQPKRLSAGWAFYYQSREYVETGALEAMLVGNGPVVIRDDGHVIEGGSLDHDPEQMLTW
ncbi:MAG: YrhB domain-containing protein [Brevundimonas sp.]|uniref:YrhB domain-containing protein n=1 Tax=Brevundimonas sp. TaxID=1871086 RepID=UPI00276414B0|nr:YrhB domain-containing protein [Brevundimonas sp.]MDP3401749.1 YrhB domain-containing protein [Brevundimonas sp.]MDZ4113980.1 YrhB domain-containing protein [Brevundimonas sp.]